MKIKPNNIQIENWINNYVPDKDMFFLTEEGLNKMKKYLEKVLVIPRSEFFNHASYTQIQLVNSYIYWMISKEVAYIVVANGEWVEELPKSVQKELFFHQKKHGKGLILPSSFIPKLEAIPDAFIVQDSPDNFIILRSKMWNRLSYDIKVTIIKNVAQSWEDWDCESIPANTPEHIKKYANTFSVIAGANCLAATLFAITGSEWLVNEWVHPDTFEIGLKNAGYLKVDGDDIQSEDVVIWENAEGVVQHAAYHLGKNLYFNKSGQNVFNPWKIVKDSRLKDEWKDYSIVVYRKC